MFYNLIVINMQSLCDIMPALLDYKRSNYNKDSYQFKIMSAVELRQVTDFLSRYQISQINPETLLLTSKKSNFLVKSHKIDGDYDEIVEILDKHLSFDQEYVCPLMHFEQSENQDCDKTIRAVYHVDKMTLKDSIEIRRQNEDYFPQSEIWILLSSLVNSLIYLQEKDVVYGVLSLNKIFIQDKIRVMDPTAFNINPLNISRLSLHSPEIRMNKNDIDFYQSDVYLLGLCILSAASLGDIDNNVGEEEIEGLLGEVQKRYSSDLLHVLKYMLKMEAQERPTFQNIREYIQTEIQIKEARVVRVDPLIADQEDCIIQDENLEEVDHQNIDILENQQENMECRNEYEQAKQRYLYSTIGKKFHQATNCQSSLESIEQMDSIQFIGQKDTISLRKSNYFVQEFKLTHFGGQNPPETTQKAKKRAHQIKNRNSQVVKTIHSVIIPNHQQTEVIEGQHPFTSPELMSMLKLETKRARQFFIGTSRRLKD